MTHKEFTPQQAGAEYERQQADSLLKTLGTERNQKGWHAVKSAAKVAVLGVGAGLTLLGGVGIAMAHPGGYLLLPGAVTLAGAVKAGFHEAQVGDAIDDWRSAASDEKSAKLLTDAGQYSSALGMFGAKRRK
jgi:hypothetical protein